MPENLREIYLLKVSINDVAPPIWRSIRVQNSIDLWQLHMILQAAVGWENSHLHQFFCDGNIYGVPDPEFGNGVLDESHATLHSVLKKPGDSILYLYDFGDGWEHTIQLEKILPYSHEISFPACLSAERNCPPENVGGPPGYQDFLEAFDNPNHPNHTDMVEWVGEEFDPRTFETSEVNEYLKSWNSSA